IRYVVSTEQTPNHRNKKHKDRKPERAALITATELKIAATHQCRTYRDSEKDHKKHDRRHAFGAGNALLFLSQRSIPRKDNLKVNGPAPECCCFNSHRNLRMVHMWTFPGSSLI